MSLTTYGKLVGHNTGNATFTDSEGNVTQLRNLELIDSDEPGVYSAYDEEGFALTVEDGEEYATLYVGLDALEKQQGSNA